jgi:hypothetical protein
MTTKQNPLLSIMRQPKIYIRLPSNGRFWPENSINPTMNSEYPVFSMTARDELLLKTPDALLNGQAVVDVIQSCMPNILDAWQTPNIDLDVILIAIRLATYGEKMETEIKLGSETLTYELDLRTILDQLQNDIKWIDRIDVNKEVIVFVKPLNYLDVTKTSIQTLETQKIIALANNEQMGDEQKIQAFRESFSKLTEVTVGLVANSVYKIDSVAGSTDSPAFIQEYMANCDKSVFTAIKDHLDKQREQNSLKPIKVSNTAENIANGGEPEVLIPVVFDPANFFG